MRLKARLKRLEDDCRARGDLDPPPPPPTREQRLERTTRRLRDAGTGALWGMHTPQLWPALRDWRAVREGTDFEAQAEAYVALQEALVHALDEHGLRSRGQVGRCNALPAINSHYGGRPHEVRPLPQCPACGICHTDHPEALQLAAERMQRNWPSVRGAHADGESEWAELALLVVDGPPRALLGWCEAQLDGRRRPDPEARPGATSGNSC